MRRSKRQSSDKAHGGFGRQFVRLADAGTAHHRQIVLVPGAAVPLLTLDLPTRLRGLAREQVARRQLQDRLGLSPEKVEMRPYRGASKNVWNRVLVADTGLVQTWRERVTGNRAVMLPDYLALPTTEGLCTVHTSDGEVAVRLGPDNGFGGQSDVALIALAKAFADPDQAPKAVLMLGATWSAMVALAEKHDVPVVHDVADVVRIDGLERPTVLEHGEMTCNLCRDPALVRDKLRNQIVPWRWPVAILVLAVTLWIASDMLEIQRLRDERIAIQIATEEIVRDVFLPDGPILDIRSQVLQSEQAMRRAATGGVAGDNALALFERVAATVFETGARTLRVSSPDGSRLDLVIETSDFAAADGLTASLASNELEVRVVGSRRTGDGTSVRTELQVRAQSWEEQP